MSSMVLLKVPKSGSVEEYKEFANSHLGASLIWDALMKKYIMPSRTPKDEEYKWSMFNTVAMKKLFALVDDPKVPFSERAVLASTFDNVICKRDDFERLAAFMESFDETYPGKPNRLPSHLLPQAEALRKLAKTDCLGCCWIQTSVCDDVWDVWEEEKEESRPYDASKDKKHWFLFDEVIENPKT